MRISIIQLLVEGAESERNTQRATRFIEQAVDQKTDLILLPETIDFGWTHPEGIDNAKIIPGEYSKLFCDLALKHKVWICVGLTEKGIDLNFNSAILINRKGEIVLKHRKINLLEVELPFYQIGSKIEVVNTEFGIIGLNICADNYWDSKYLGESLAAMGANLILSPSSWTVDHSVNETIDPYDDKWIKPYSYLASNFNLIVASTTSVGYLVGGPYVGKKMIGKSLVLGPNGIIDQGVFNEFSSHLLLVDLILPSNKLKVEESGNNFEKSNEKP